MKRTVLLFAILLMIPVSASAQTMELRLTVNNVQNNVYIPDTGVVAADSLGAGTTYFPEHFYITSYLSNFVYALAAAMGTSVYASNDGISHNISVSQPLQDSRILLGLTTGDYERIDDAMPSIEDGSFFKEISPSFSFGAGFLNPVKILLSYADINITGDVHLSSGFRKITISNTGYANGKPIVEIGST
jgi:hypothetical protein